MEEEYEIVPEKEVEDLKKQIEDIKKNPLGSSTSGRELVRSIKDLNDSVNHLVGLFRDAADAMKLEEKESEAIGNKLAPMLDKMNTLIDQNERIARGIVGLADMVKEDIKKPAAKAVPMPERPPTGIIPPGAPPGPPIEPRQDIRAPPMSGPMPPGAPPGPPAGATPPPAAPKKKRLFGF